MILGIDTSSILAAGVADGERVLASLHLDHSRAHAEQLMPLVARALAEAGVGTGDLDAVAVGMGPGPFTGLRVGIATAQTLGWTLGVEVHRVCSLDVLARQSGRADEYVVATDARRRELYWARYRGVERVDGPRVDEPAALAALALDVPVVGPGPALYPEALGDVAAPGVDRLDAGVLARDAARFAPVGETPLYLRRPDATVPTRRKSTLVVPRAPRAGRRP